MPDRPEAIRRARNVDRVLAHLQAHGQATNVELVAIGGMRAGARIFELRKQGHVITSEHVTDGVWRFIYRGYVAPGQAALPLSA